MGSSWEEGTGVEMGSSGSSGRWSVERMAAVASIVGLVFAVIGFGGYGPLAKSKHWWPFEKSVPPSSRRASDISLPDHYSLASWLRSLGVTGHELGHATLSVPRYTLIDRRAYAAVSVRDIDASMSATFSVDCSRSSGSSPAPGPYLVHLHEPPAETRAIAQDGGFFWDGNGPASAAAFTMEGAACNENGTATGTRWASVTTTPAFPSVVAGSVPQTLVFPIPDDARAELVAFVFIADDGDYVVAAL